MHVMPVHACALWRWVEAGAGTFISYILTVLDAIEIQETVEVIHGGGLHTRGLGECEVGLGRGRTKT